MKEHPGQGELELACTMFGNLGGVDCMCTLVMYTSLMMCYNKKIYTTKKSIDLEARETPGKATSPLWGDLKRSSHGGSKMNS